MIVVCSTTAIAGTECTNSTPYIPYEIAYAASLDNAVCATVINHTEEPVYMRFWLTGFITHVGGEQVECEQPRVIKLNKKWKKKFITYELTPGENSVLLKLKSYYSDATITNLTLNGGLNLSTPMMDSMTVEDIEPTESTCTEDTNEGAGTGITTNRVVITARF